MPTMRSDNSASGEGRGYTVDSEWRRRKPDLRLLACVSEAFTKRKVAICYRSGNYYNSFDPIPVIQRPWSGAQLRTLVDVSRLELQVITLRSRTAEKWGIIVG